LPPFYTSGWRDFVSSFCPLQQLSRRKSILRWAAPILMIQVQLVRQCGFQTWSKTSSREREIMPGTARYSIGFPSYCGKN
jgi:hypothetical protein